MISETEARAKILEAVQPLRAQKVPVLAAVDRFAAEDYFARLPLPMFDNSAMDGYAVVASGCKRGARLRLVGEQPAGNDRKLRASKTEAIRIFTGAPIPAGADAVVMQEDVERSAGDIVVNVNVEAGEFIRKRGCDLGEGQKILSSGERITVTKLALLASQGLGEVLAGGQVRAAIVSTGDELATPGEQLQPGQIYDSNAVLLQSLVQRCNALAASVERGRDEPKSLSETLRRAAGNEIMIVTGGVSVGEHDLVQKTLRELGAKIDMWRVAIKPGKPFLFGTLGDCFVFGLPGNPVSAFVTFLQVARPAILKMMRAADVDLPKLPARLDVDLTNDSDRAHYFRGKVERGIFAPIGRQESHALFGLSQSNALLRLDVAETRKRGEMVEIQMW